MISFRIYERLLQITVISSCPIFTAERFLPIHERITRGSDVPPHDYPWAVHITTLWQNGDQSVCGGTLITPNKILTAAHCVRKLLFFEKRVLNATNVTILLGKHNLMEYEIGQIRFRLNMDEVYVHPNFNILKFENDVAVIMLPEHLENNSSIQPVKLPSNAFCRRNLYDFQKINETCSVLTAVGWGMREDREITEILKGTELETQPPNICARYFGFLDRDTQICALGKSRSDTCHGDSGGPVTCKLKSSGNIVLVAQISAGSVKCSRESHSPAIYIQYCAYIKWLRSLPCGSPPLVSNGAWIESDSSDLLELTCRGSTRIDGGRYLICRNGIWIGSFGRCIQTNSSIKCPDPYIENAKISDGSNWIGSRRKVICNSNFSQVGSGIIKCLNHRQWSNHSKCIPRTAIAVSPNATACLIPSIPNVKMSVIMYRGYRNISSDKNDTIFIGVPVTISCAEGYTRVGSHRSLCSAGGVWLPPIAKCVPAISASIQGYDSQNCRRPSVNSPQNGIKPSEMPWITRIHVKRRDSTVRYCSGSLITDEWVLTAAHCLSPGNISMINLFFERTYFPSSRGATHVIRKARYFVIHQNFTGIDKGYNFGLIKLMKPITDNYVKPICLPNGICQEETAIYQSRIDGCSRAMGGTWNISSTQGGLAKPVLKVVDMKIWSPASCTSRARLFGINISESQMCAGSRHPRQYACNSDGGGPLTCQDDDNVYLLGIVSSGLTSKCGVRGMPRIYSRVCSVLPWIRKNIS